jgi:hypothetical protein
MGLLACPLVKDVTPMLRSVGRLQIVSRTRHGNLISKGPTYRVQMQADRESAYTTILDAMQADTIGHIRDLIRRIHRFLRDAQLSRTRTFNTAITIPSMRAGMLSAWAGRIDGGAAKC